MKTITKIGVSAIGAAAVACVGYLGKKIYNKSKKSSNIDVITEDSTQIETTNEQQTENCTK